MRPGRHLFLMVAIAFLSACGQEEAEDNGLAEPVLQKVAFSDLPGWQGDDLNAVLPALQKSCARILKKPDESAFGPLPQAGIFSDWRPACEDLMALTKPSHEELRMVIEARFQPWEIRAGTNPNGLFTGYYEASLKGSLKRSESFTVPLYARPDDLVMVDLGDFREELKGQRIAGRVIDARLKPYEAREQIVAGEWPHNDKVLVWVDDPIEAFFVQIQGSGVVDLEDGTTLRIGYDGQNGHPYYAIGRELIAIGALEKEQVSLQAIRTWLQDNPDRADEIMNTNRSYVFFKTLEGEGPVGGEGVALTPGRSLAVDYTMIGYGIPIWVDIDPPLEGEARLQRLMVAQDTGGAIRGAVRGDVFWGHGAQAEHFAGHMKSQGRYWVLLPKAAQSDKDQSEK